MATLTAARAASTFPGPALLAGQGMQCAWGTYTLAANPTAADIIQFCEVPANVDVVGGWLMGPDIDTNATETFDMDIGWAANGAEVADPDGFGNFAVSQGDAVPEFKPVAGIYQFLQGVLMVTGPQRFTKKTMIQGVVNVAAATGGTGALSLVVLYVPAVG